MSSASGTSGASRKSPSGNFTPKGFGLAVFLHLND
jgi:hypothetical protein